jgi:hypothetical protein
MLLREWPNTGPTVVACAIGESQSQNAFLTLLPPYSMRSIAKKIYLCETRLQPFLARARKTLCLFPRKHNKNFGLDAFILK